MPLQKYHCVIRVLVPAIFCMVVSACSFMQKPQKVFFSIKMPESTLIRFEGKGAAAGVMMSSSMGPMGIAIGVAIDEGIAKEIREALNRSGCNVDDVVAQAFRGLSGRYGQEAVLQSSLLHNKVDVLLRINGLIFKVRSPEQDLTSVELVAGIEVGGVVRELTSAHSDAGTQGAPLEVVRTDGDTACRLIGESASALFEVWYKQGESAAGTYPSALL